MIIMCLDCGRLCDNRDDTKESIVLALKWLIGCYRMGHKCEITGEKGVARPCSILLNESEWGKDKKKEIYKLVPSHPFSPIVICAVDSSLSSSTGLLGSRDSWPRYKSIIVPFSDGFRWN